MLLSIVLRVLRITFIKEIRQTGIQVKCKSQKLSRKQTKGHKKIEYLPNTREMLEIRDAKIFSKEKESNEKLSSIKKNLDDIMYHIQNESDGDDDTSKIKNNIPYATELENDKIYQLTKRYDNGAICINGKSPRIDNVVVTKQSDDTKNVKNGKRQICDGKINGKRSAEESTKSHSGKKRQEDDSKIIKFRCDFSSMQSKVMQARGWTQIVDPEDMSWTIWWCEITDVRVALDSKLSPRQKIPHFRNHYELTRKNYLCRNLKRYKKLLLKTGKISEAELCDSMPITFELPNEYRMLVEEYHKQQGSTWIVKPAGRSQGKGIFLFRKLKDLADWRSKEYVGLQQAEVAPEIFLVQKYVDDPYLLAGRKFDLRIYVLVTSFRPLNVWLAREGFARLSTELFDLRNIDDSRVHLTNMAIQLKRNKNDDNSVNERIKQGCKWALVKVREYLTARHGAIVVEDLLQQIAGVIMASLLAVQPVMMQGKNSFELYGYDILLDENLKPWLLEVNASPALTGTDDEDHRLKFDLVNDTLNVIDLEGRFSGREIRIGGFDLLWNDGPVFIDCPNPTICGESTSNSRRLNVFLGAKNDRERQLQLLQETLDRQDKL